MTIASAYWPNGQTVLAIILLIAALTVVYPFIIYTNLDAWGPANLAWGLFALLLARVLLRGDFKKPEQFVQLLLVGGLCMFSVWLESEALLRYYPVAMSVAFAAFFIISLNSETSLIERFASIRGRQTFAVHQKHYMRQLTKAWATLLLINAVIAAYTACCMSLASWTFYNGLLSYLVLGIFSLCELIFRHFYRQRHQM